MAEKRQARVLGPLDCALAKKLARRSQDMGNTTSTKVAERGLEPTKDAGTTTPFKLSGEFLYGGQGKDNSLVTPDCIDNTAFGYELGCTLLFVLLLRLDLDRHSNLRITPNTAYYRMVTPSRGVIWPMTTTVLACPGIGVNHSNTQ
jgi:hypothetical protein